MMVYSLLPDTSKRIRRELTLHLSHKLLHCSCYQYLSARLFPFSQFTLAPWQTMTFFRRISPVEATHLAKDKLPDGQFVNQFFIEGHFVNGQTHFNKQDWENAVRKASEANPAINSQLRGRWGFRYWKNTGKIPEVLCYEGSWDGCSSTHFENIAPFINPRRDSNASIVLINQLASDETPAKALILFRIHHGLCDGAATAHWIQEVFRALRGETLAGSISTLNEYDIVKRVDYPKPEVFRGRCLPVFPKSSQAEKQACHWIKYHWDQSEKRIVAKLLWILRKVAVEQHGEGRTVFRLSADLRHYLNAEELQNVQFSNLSGIFDIDVKADDSVKRIQFKIIKALRNKQDLSVYPKRMLPLTRWVPGSIFNIKAKDAEKMHARGLCNITGMIGYANHIDLDAISFDGFSASGAFAIPMPIQDKSVFMGVASSPKGIDVIISAPNALSNTEHAFALAERIEQELEKL